VMNFLHHEMHRFHCRSDRDPHAFRGLGEVTRSLIPSMPMTLALTMALKTTVAVTTGATVVAASAPSPSSTAALVPAITAAVITTTTKIAVATIPPLALTRGFFVTKLGLFFRRCIFPGPGRAQLECGQQALGQLIGRVAHGADTSDPAGNDKPALRQFERAFPALFRPLDAALGDRVAAFFVNQQREHQPHGDETR